MSSKSSEDVLLQVAQVRYKKGDGSLFLMDSRLIWMVENRDTVVVSHPYADIKSQKISPEGKAKVQLQVVLHGGASSTFHFANAGGTAAQVADRDRVKERLQALLPRFKRRVDRELEEKNRLLSQRPALLQLYKDLVMSGVVTSEEFWARHAGGGGGGGQASQAPPQEVGVSGAFLADIKPQTDGCNGLKYNITPDVVECIFKTYPAVRAKYAEHVPSRLSEAQFWTKFFQSHYFHRDRKYAEAKDLFTECGRLDEGEMRRDVQAGVRDPLLDLRAFDDRVLEEGYGGAGAGAAGPPPSAPATVSQAMIRRFNQHSVMVLKATSGQRDADADADPPPDKRRRILDKITYDDLEAQQNGDAHVHLNLSKVERYLHGPMPETGGAVSSERPAAAPAGRNALQEWARAAAGGRPGSAAPLVSPAAAVSALGELSPGGALMRGFQEQSLAQLVPGDIEREVRHLYLALCELLAHFWRCFPPAPAHNDQKLLKMHEALQRFHSAKLKPFEDKLLRELSPLSQHLTKHLNQLLNAAYRKFNNWQKVKGR